MDWINFFTQLGLNILGIVLGLTFLYWISLFYKRFCSNLKYWIKYKVFRKKYNEDDVKGIFKDIENGLSSNEIFKSILISGKRSLKEAKEIMYIHDQIKKLQLKKMKGGKNK